MLDDDLESQSAGATMFPFLSVLFCAIGALVIIMVIGSLKTTVKDESIDVSLVNAVALHEQLKNLNSYVSTINTSLTGIAVAREEASGFTRDAAGYELDAEKESGDLAGLAEDGEQAADFIEKVDLARVKQTTRLAFDSTLKTWQKSKADVDRVRSRVQALSQSITDATGELDVLKQKAGMPEVRILIGDDPDGRKPVVIELRKEAAVVLTEGAPRGKDESIPAAEAAADGGFFDELAAAVARPGSAQYALLLVQPDAVGTFFEATERLRRQRAPYAAEPVEKNWKYVFAGAGAAPN